jgi:hypothetical protein
MDFNNPYWPYELDDGHEPEETDIDELYCDYGSPVG